MKKNVTPITIFALIAAMILLCCNTVSAASHGKKLEKKTGILLVAFGSSKASARVSFDNIQKKTAAAYPDIPVFWAYTSHIIRHKLAKQGIHLDSPEVALAKMADQGFTHVAVQSLHTIAGSEYHDLQRVISGFRTMGVFKDIALGDPLLATQEDMQRAVRAILSTIPAERKKDEAVVLMGHGTHHPSNAFYAALMFQVQLEDPNVFIGTVEGYPELDTVTKMLKAKSIKSVWLMPFMSVAGDHAMNDMAGDESDSWKSLLSKEGVDCETVMKGTAEYDAYISIWVDHLKAPLDRF